MTDQELTKSVAETVMGWTYTDAITSTMGEYHHLARCWAAKSDDSREFQFRAPSDWDPLTDDQAACAVLDKIRDLGWKYDVMGGRGNDSCRITTGFPHQVFYACESNRRRAIVLASLKARGVDCS